MRENACEGSLRPYGIEAILLPADASLAGTLKESKNWRAVYDDTIAIVFRRAASRGDGLSAEQSTSSVSGTSGKTSDRKVTRSPVRIYADAAREAEAERLLD
jgi:hypothetical protein